MGRKKKSYLDLFLDNEYKAKKRTIYFLEEQEEAVVKMNSKDVSEREKARIYEEILEPAFRKIIVGVLEMPKFHNLLGMNRNDLMEETYCRLIEKLEKFTPGRIGKNGQPVKAYSYFSTIAKNFILERKVRHEKVLSHKADVEHSIDLHILSEDTLKKMSNYDKQDVHFDSYENIFSDTSNTIVAIINKVIKEEESKNEKKDENVIKIGYILKYLLDKWEIIEFNKKNEFMRILTLYTGLRQQQVSSLFKRYKTEILKKLNPRTFAASQTTDNNVDTFDLNDEEDEYDNIEDETEDDDAVEKKTFHDVITMEDFEMLLDKEESDKKKKSKQNEI